MQKDVKPESNLLSRNRNKRYQERRRRRKKRKFRSMTDVMHAVYFIAQQVDEVQFIPGDQSVIFNGMTISLSAPKATSICYSDATIIPACKPDGSGCLAGNRIQGSNGVTMGLTEDTTLRAIGCTDTTSTPAAGINSMMKEATYSVYTTFTNPTDEEEEEEEEEEMLRSNTTHPASYSNVSAEAVNAPIITQNAAPININITLGGGYICKPNIFLFTKMKMAVITMVLLLHRPIHRPVRIRCIIVAKEHSFVHQDIFVTQLKLFLVNVTDVSKI